MMNTVSRRAFLGSVTASAALLTLSRSRSFAWGQAPSTAPAVKDLGFTTNAIAMKKPRDNLFVLSGPGGNITVMTGSDGPLVIDTGVPQRGPDVVKAVTERAGSAPKTVIDTHWHFDHAGGNAAFTAAGVSPIIAHENTLKRLSSPQHNTAFNMDFPASPKEALPTKTFADSMKLDINGKSVQLQHVAPAHTDSDILIHFPDDQVLVTGDLVFNGLYPFIDYDSAGSIEGMIAACKQLRGIVNDQYTIVPGHGDVMTAAELGKYQEMLETVRDRLSKLAKEKLSVDEAIARRPLAELDPVWGQRFMNGATMTRIVYPHLL